MYHGERIGELVPHLRKIDPFGDNSGSAFLLRVKSEVAARQTSAACGRPRRLDAAERAELQFARGALLSDTTEDSQGSSLALSNSDSQHDGRMSVRSDGATVAGRINPERAYEALKAKLRREQHSAAEIEFEMACHLDPRDARREHRRRRHLRNAAILQRCRRQRDSYAPHLCTLPTPFYVVPVTVVAEIIAHLLSATHVRSVYNTSNVCCVDLITKRSFL